MERRKKRENKVLACLTNEGKETSPSTTSKPSSNLLHRCGLQLWAPQTHCRGSSLKPTQGSLLQRATGSNREPQRATGSHMEAQGAPRSHREPATWSHREPWGATGSIREPCGITGSHREPEGATRFEGVDGGLQCKWL